MHPDGLLNTIALVEAEWPLVVDLRHQEDLSDDLVKGLNRNSRII